MFFFILVGALFILLYSVQLRWDGYGNDAPTATLRTPSTPTNGQYGRFRAAGGQGAGQAAGRMDYCPATAVYSADIETSQLFPTLELNPSWITR